MKILRYAFFILSVTAIMGFVSDKKPSLKLAMKTLEGMCVYVPSGLALIEKDTVSLQGFYISQGEVTNLQYREFLADLKRTGQLEKYNTAQVDSSNWSKELKSINQKYVDFYHSHPAYNNYPVVNISKEGAELYCEWLTAKYDSLSNGELKLEFRLPVRSEWLRAARGDDYNRVYSWKGATLDKQDGKKHFQGQVQANCIRNGAECITRNQETGKLEVTLEGVAYTFGDHADILAPSISYWPNDFGIYNMNGNVAEMVSDKDIVVGGDWRSPGYDIRNESTRTYKGASVTVGFRVVATYHKPTK